MKMLEKIAIAKGIIDNDGSKPIATIEIRKSDYLDKHFGHIGHGRFMTYNKGRIKTNLIIVDENGNEIMEKASIETPAGGWKKSKYGRPTITFNGYHIIKTELFKSIKKRIDLLLDQGNELEEIIYKPYNMVIAFGYRDKNGNWLDEDNFPEFKKLENWRWIAENIDFILDYLKGQDEFVILDIESVK